MDMIDCVVDARAALGECPVWSTQEQLLYWVDIEGRKIHRFNPATGSDEHRRLRTRPGSLALTTLPGRLLVANEHRAGWFDWDTGTLTNWLELEPGGSGNRLNDGRCDPAGRFWVGSMFARAADNRFTGLLHRVEGSGSFETVRREIGVTNGLAFSPDGSTMYFADTLHDSVWAYDYDVDSGTQSNERLFLDFTDQPGRPDGACVDAEGCYWVACVYGWALLRVTPAGRVDRRVDVPVERPTMPAFGGSGLETLFFTSIGSGGSIPPTGDEPRAGGLFALDPGVTGLPESLFAGSAPS